MKKEIWHLIYCNDTLIIERYSLDIKNVLDVFKILKKNEVKKTCFGIKKCLGKFYLDKDKFLFEKKNVLFG